MLKVPDITNDPRQKFTINLPEGNRLALEMRFCPTQNAWYLDIDYNDGEWVLKGTQQKQRAVFCGRVFDWQMHYVYFGKQGRF